MKRKFKMILTCSLAAAFGAALGFAPSVVRAEESNRAEVGGTAYSFEEAIGHWSDGTTLKLVSDVTVPSAVVLSENSTRTLDLNGYTLSLAENVKKSRLLTVTAGALTVTDSSAGGTGMLSGGDVGGDEESSGSDGGVISVTDATFTLSGGTVAGGVARHGGGIFAKKATVTLSGGTVEGNSAQNGGGVYAEDALLTLNGTTVTGNSAAINGGGVYLNGATEDAATAQFSAGTVTQNSAGYLGGGVVVWNGAEFGFSGGSITANTAIGGGGVYVLGNANSNPKVVSRFFMTGGEIKDNRATESYGGGIKISACGIVTVRGGEIGGNTAVGEGGGISVESGGRAVFGKSPRVANNTASSVKDNVYIMTITDDAPIQFENGLSAQAVVGFNIHENSAVLSDNYGGKWENIGGITADDEGCEIYRDGDVIMLGSTVPRALTVTVDRSFKREYQEGETFEPAGMTVTVVYRDGRTKQVELGEVEVENGSELKAGMTSVTVRYQGISATVAISVAGTVSAESTGSPFGFIAVIALAALIVVALIVVGFLSHGFKGKPKE